MIKMINKKTGEISYFDEKEVARAKKDRRFKLHIYKVSKEKFETLENLENTDIYTGVWE